MDRRGIDLKTLLGSYSEEESKDGNHILLECSLARQLWLKVARWVDQHITTFSSVTNIMHWIDMLSSTHFHREIMESVCVGNFKGYIASWKVLSIPHWWGNTLLMSL